MKIVLGIDHCHFYMIHDPREKKEERKKGEHITKISYHYTAKTVKKMQPSIDTAITKSFFYLES